MHKFASVCLCLPLSAFACSACLCLCLPQAASTCLRLPPPDFNIDFDLKFKQSNVSDCASVEFKNKLNAQK
jgi:hypothetical protein